MTMHQQNWWKGWPTTQSTRSVERVANDAIDAFGIEGGQQRNRRDRWREWPTTLSMHLVLRVANDAIDVIGGESGQRRYRCIWY